MTWDATRATFLLLVGLLMCAGGAFGVPVAVVVMVVWEWWR